MEDLTALVLPSIPNSHLALFLFFHSTYHLLRVYLTHCIYYITFTFYDLYLPPTRL